MGPKSMTDHHQERGGQWEAVSLAGDFYVLVFYHGLKFTMTCTKCSYRQRYSSLDRFLN